MQTTPAPGADFARLPPRQAALATRAGFPAAPLVEAGSVTAAPLVASHKGHDVILGGPVPPDASGQAQAPHGGEVAACVVRGDTPPVPGPQGRESVLWVPGHDRHGQPVIPMRFARTDCSACPVRAPGTPAASQPRTLTMRPRAQPAALHAARQRQVTAAFTQEYANRAGGAGTMSQAVRTAGGRRGRSMGLAKTPGQPRLTAAALKLRRVAAWGAERPRAHTRLSPWAALARASA